MAEQSDQIDDDSSRLINILEFQTKWSGLEDFSADSMRRPTFNKLAEELDLPVQTIKDLSLVCSPDTLFSGDEAFDEAFHFNSIPDTQLKTLQQQKQDLLRRKNSYLYRGFQTRNQKYKLKSVHHEQKSNNRNDIPEDRQVPLPNVILTGDIYRQSLINKTYLTQDQIVLVRGDTLLSEFRDSIDCLNDLAVAGEFSENLAAASQAVPCKDTMKSALLYIEDTFYNDTRFADNRDYSKVIIDFMKNSCQPAKKYKTAPMESVQFGELNIKLGEPYLYLHQGNCEHIIIFSDLRMFTSADSQDKDDYPFIVCAPVLRRILCKSCTMYTARWQVEESKLTPVDPCYLCESCLKSLHYDENGQKVGHFKAFKFVNTSSDLNTAT